MIICLNLKKDNNLSKFEDHNLSEFSQDNDLSNFDQDNNMSKF